MWANGADPGHDLKSVVLSEHEASNCKKKKKITFYNKLVWNLFFFF